MKKYRYRYFEFELLLFLRIHLNWSLSILSRSCYRYNSQKFQGYAAILKLILYFYNIFFVAFFKPFYRDIICIEMIKLKITQNFWLLQGALGFWFIWYEMKNLQSPHLDWLGQKYHQWCSFRQFLKLVSEKKIRVGREIVGA